MLAPLDAAPVAATRVGVRAVAVAATLDALHLVDAPVVVAANLVAPWAVAVGIASGPAAGDGEALLARLAAAETEVAVAVRLTELAAGQGFRPGWAAARVAAPPPTAAARSPPRMVRRERALPRVLDQVVESTIVHGCVLR
jgi:hypothetical protein